MHLSTQKKHVRFETRNTILFKTLSHNHRPLAASCPSLSLCTTLPCFPYNVLKLSTLTAVYTVSHRQGLLVTEYMGLFLFEFGWSLLMLYFWSTPTFPKFNFSLQLNITVICMCNTFNSLRSWWLLRSGPFHYYCNYECNKHGCTSISVVGCQGLSIDAQEWHSCNT